MKKIFHITLLLFKSYHSLFAALTSGITINFDASDDVTGDATWAANVGGGTRDWTFVSGNKSPVAVADADTPGITQAYSFFDESVKATDYDGLGSQSDASFELWLKVNSTIINGKVIFETGGATVGCFIRHYQNWFIVGAKDNDFIVSAAAEVDDYEDRHHQIVVTYDFDGSGGNVNLFIDGQFACSDYLTDWTDWSGTDDAGLASRFSAMPLNGPNEAFKGEISIFRFYQNKALTPAEVLNNYNEVAATPGANILDTAILNNNMVIDIVYNADDAGIDSVNHWAPKPETTLLSYLNPWAWEGPDPPLISIDDRRVSFNKAYNMTGAESGKMTTDWARSQENGLIEIWLKPDDFSGQELIYELGGTTDGVSLLLDESTIRLISVDDTFPVSVEYELSSQLEGQFIQVGNFFELSNEAMHLYVNGACVGSNTLSGWADYAGTDDNGLGGVEAAYGGNVSGYGDYNGLLSYIKYSSNFDSDMTQTQANTQILTNYNELRQGRGTIFSIK
jgi:hypothetical protein